MKNYKTMESSSKKCINFFFTPIEAYQLAFFRVLFGAFAFIDIFAIFRNKLIDHSSSFYSIFYYNYFGEFFEYIIIVISLIFSVFICIGLYSQISALIILLFYLNLIPTKQTAIFCGSDFFKIYLFFLVILQTGILYSFDRLIIIWKTKDIPSINTSPFIFRILQVIFIVAYLSDIIYKLSFHSIQSMRDIFELLILVLFPILFCIKNKWVLILSLFSLLYIAVNQKINSQLIEWKILFGCFMFSSIFGIKQLEIFIITLLQYVFRFKNLRVIYDGDCGICTSTKIALEETDVLKKIIFKNGRNMIERVEFTDFDLARFEKEIIAYCENGKVFGGFFAMRQILLRIPIFLPISLLFFIPGFSFIGSFAYNLVAKNRNRISSFMFKGQGCKLN